MAWILLNAAIPEIVKEGILKYIDLNDLMCFEVACHGLECDVEMLADLFSERTTRNKVFRYNEKLFEKTITSALFDLVKLVDLSCCDVKAAHLHILAKQQEIRGISINFCEGVTTDDLIALLRQLRNLEVLTMKGQSCVTSVVSIIDGISKCTIQKCQVVI